MRAAVVLLLGLTIAACQRTGEEVVQNQPDTLATVQGYSCEQAPSTSAAANRVPMNPGADTVPEYRGMASIQFVSTIQPADMEWICGQGFAIVQVNEAASIVSVKVPTRYNGNPLANPRVKAYDVQMR